MYLHILQKRGQRTWLSTCIYPTVLHCCAGLPARNPLRARRACYMRLANGTYVRVLVLYVIERTVRQTWTVISDALACRPGRCTYIRQPNQRLGFSGPFCNVCFSTPSPFHRWKIDGSDACVRVSSSISACASTHTHDRPMRAG